MDAGGENRFYQRPCLPVDLFYMSAIITPFKPRFLKDPCNGCGICCVQAKCYPGTLAFPNHEDGTTPCPALRVTQDKTRTYCGLVAVEAISGMPPMIAEILGIGKGCTMQDDAIELRDLLIANKHCDITGGCV